MASGRTKETSLQYLKRILRIDISLTAWDFDSTTLACQLTVIDRDLLLKIPAIELAVLLCQKNCKNAPNVGAFEAFAHRISCLVATEVLRDDTEKIRARLVARLINTAEKCHRMGNFQSCQSILTGLQSPSVYRLHSTWSYVRKRHGSKYQVFEALCRIYRDPRLPAYQRAFHLASRERPYLVYLGDVLAHLLDRIPPNAVASLSKQRCDCKSEGSSGSLSTNAFKKLLLGLGMIPSSHDGKDPRPSDGGDFAADDPLQRLKKAVQFLERCQRAAATYMLRKSDLAREYLLKARYREERENFFFSFTVEQHLHNSYIHQFISNK